MTLERHPFPPFVPKDPQMLFLGTFPPQPKRWKMEFYYPNWNNDFWRVCGVIFYGDRDRFCDVDNKCFKLDDIVEFLTARHIAIYDTAMEVERLKDNASDKYLDICRPIDLDSFLATYPTLSVLVSTGEKAASVVASLTGTEIPTMGQKVSFEYAGRIIWHFRMPSTSRAYPLALEKKAELYARVFQKNTQNTPD